MTVIGDVEGADVILVDDMADTAGTLCKAAQAILDEGAKSVRALTTHAMLSGNAYKNLENSQLSELIVTDSIPLKQEHEKIRVLSCAGLFSDVMQRVHRNTSISSKFLM